MRFLAFGLMGIGVALILAGVVYFLRTINLLGLLMFVIGGGVSFWLGFYLFELSRRY